MSKSKDAVVELFKSFHDIPIRFYPIHRMIGEKLTTTILMAYLLRQFQYHKKDTIFYTDEQIMEETSLTERELRGAKDDMKALGFIDVNRAGYKGRTHYTVDWVKLAIVASSCSVKRAKQEPSVPSKGRNTIKEDTKEIKDTTLSLVADATDGTKCEGEKFEWENMTTKLHSTIGRVRKINSKSKPKGWWKYFRTLHRLDGYEIPRIWKALKWYCRELPNRYGTDKYFPQAYAAQSFREKFVKIETAMERQKVELEGPIENDTPTAKRTQVGVLGNDQPLPELD